MLTVEHRSDLKIEIEQNAIRSIKQAGHRQDQIAVANLIGFSAMAR